MEVIDRRLMWHGMFLFLLGLLTGFAEPEPGTMWAALAGGPCHRWILQRRHSNSCGFRTSALGPSRGSAVAHRTQFSVQQRWRLTRMYLERKSWTGARGPVVISALGIDPARKWAKRKLLANLARLTIRDTHRDTQ